MPQWGQKHHKVTFQSLIKTLYTSANSWNILMEIKNLSRQILARLQIWLSKKLFDRNNLASPLLIHETCWWKLKSHPILYLNESKISNTTSKIVWSHFVMSKHVWPCCRYTTHTRSVDEDEFPYLSCSANFLQSLNGFSHPSCALKKDARIWGTFR